MFQHSIFCSGGAGISRLTRTDWLMSELASSAPFPDRVRFWLDSGRWLHVAHAAMAIVALVMVFQGRQSGPVCVLSFLIVPAVGYVCSWRYRESVQSSCRALWLSVQDFGRDDRLPVAGAVVFIALPAVMVLLGTRAASNSMVSADSQPVMMEATNVLARGTSDIGRFVGPISSTLPYFATHTAKGIYSSYPSGMVVFALPTAAAARLAGADMSDGDVRLRLEKWTAACVAAGSLTLFFLLALHLGDRATALATTVLLGFGSAMYTTVGQALWQHGGVILWALLALLAEFRIARGHSPIGWTMAEALACAMMPACRLSSIMFLAVFGVWLLVRSPRRACALFALASLAYLPWAIFYQMIYGNVWGPSVRQTAAASWSFGLGEPWAAVLFSPCRGVLIYQPWLILIAWSVACWLCRCGTDARGIPAGWQWLCAVYIALHLAMVSSWRIWDGGYCWGSRLASEIIPFGALLVISAIGACWRSSPGRCFVMALICWSALFHVPAVLLKQDRWNESHVISLSRAHIWAWSDPPYLFRVVRAPG
jgi:hypothetical protein